MDRFGEKASFVHEIWAAALKTEQLASDALDFSAISII